MSKDKDALVHLKSVIRSRNIRIPRKLWYLKVEFIFKKSSELIPLQIKKFLYKI